VDFSKKRQPRRTLLDVNGNYVEASIRGGIEEEYDDGTGSYWRTDSCFKI
jgi:hypothetical protein